MTNEDIIVTTANYLTGYEIKEVKGLVFGLIVRSRGLGGNITAGLSALGGGEIKQYTELLMQTRETAIERMKEEVKKQGGNAVISMGFDSSEIGQSMSEVVAYGTAVIVAKSGQKAQPVSLS